MQAIDAAKEQIAEIVGVKSSQVYFTSGGTESNTWVFEGLLAGKSSSHVLISSIEHQSVRHATKWLETQGHEVDMIPVDSEGILDIKAFQQLIRPNTYLISAMYVNSEIGTIQPLPNLATIIKRLVNENFFPEGAPIIHSDASQAPLWLSCQMESLGLDMMTLDGHKMMGPKGVGVLIDRSRASLEPMFFGGRRSGELRAGTPPTPLIVGFAKALELAERGREERVEPIKSLQQYFWSSLKGQFGDRVTLNGSKDRRVANNINVSFSGENHEFLQTKLDHRGVACSVASTCTAQGESSMILEGINSRDKGALRFTFGHDTTEEEIDDCLSKLKNCLDKA